MKILFISDSIKKHSTGIGKYSLSLLKTLYNLDDVEITLLDWKKKKRIAKYANSTILIPNKALIFRSFFWHFFLLLKIKKISKKYDILINPSFFPNYLGNTDNMCYVIHDLTPLLFPEHHKLGRVLMFKFLLKKNVINAKIILCDSKSTKKDLMNFYDIDSGKAKIYYPSSDPRYNKLNIDKNQIEIIKKKYNLPNKFFLYVGSIEPRKNLLRVIKAYQNIKDQLSVKLVVVGAKAWKYKEIFSEIKNLSQNDIILTDFVEEEDLPAFYYMATFFIYPSLYEGFGMPLLEALQTGTPIITSFSSSIPEVCGKAAIYVDPWSIKDIQLAILLLDKSKMNRLKIIREGFKQIRKFDLKNNKEKLQEILSK